MSALDLFIQNWMLSIRTPLGVTFFYVLTTIFEPAYFALIMILTAILIWVRKGLKTTVFFCAVMVFSAAIAFALKHISNVPRLSISLVPDTDSRFPSGHATMSVAYFTMLAIIFRDFKTKVHYVFFAVFCFLTVASVCFSRLYLGAHTFSDIFAGLIIGGGVCFLASRIYFGKF